MVEKTEMGANGKEKPVKVAYTIRLDKKTGSYQQHRTGDPNLMRKIDRIDLLIKNWSIDQLNQDIGNQIFKGTIYLYSFWIVFLYFSSYSHFLPSLS